MKHVRIDRNKAGTVDPADPFVQVSKKVSAATKRGAPRRFVPGNTAFRAMRGLPILKVEEMIMVGVDERERVFRNIVPADKFNPRLRENTKGNAGVDDEEDEEDPDEDDPDAGSMGVDKTGKVVLFYMELHPKAPSMTH